MTGPELWGKVPADWPLCVSLNTRRIISHLIKSSDLLIQILCKEFPKGTVL